MNFTTDMMPPTAQELELIFTRIIMAWIPFVAFSILMFYDRRNTYHHAMIVAFCFLIIQTQLKNVNAFCRRLDLAYS